LFRADKTIDVIETLIEPKTDNVAHYNGSNNYEAILLNFEDHTFAKNVIDKVSLAYFEKNLHNVHDILSRTLIWRSFFEMVKDAKMRADKFVDIIIKSLANEASDAIFENQFDFVHASINTYSPIKVR
jgi:aminopeptidase N